MPPQNQQNNMNQSPVSSGGSMGTAMPQNSNEKKAVGPIVGVIIIVLILILGGLYFWGDKLNKEGNALTPDEIRNAADASVASLLEQSSSDEVSSIEADLNATNLNDLDKELGDIEKQLPQ